MNESLATAGVLRHIADIESQAAPRARRDRRFERIVSACRETRKQLCAGAGRQVAGCDRRPRQSGDTPAPVIAALAGITETVEPFGESDTGCERIAEARSQATCEIKADEGSRSSSKKGT